MGSHMQPALQQWENSFLTPLFCTEVKFLMFKFLYTEKVMFALKFSCKIAAKIGAEIGFFEILIFLKNLSSWGTSYEVF